MTFFFGGKKKNAAHRAFVTNLACKKLYIFTPILIKPGMVKAPQNSVEFESSGQPTAQLPQIYYFFLLPFILLYFFLIDF